MHTSPDVLALLALGETAGNHAERGHVHDCPVCSEEVAELARVVDVGRTSALSESMTSPGPEVWERIRAELGFDQAGASSAGVAAAATVTDLTLRMPRGAGDGGRRRSVRRFAALAAAAALALVVGIGAGIAYERQQVPDDRVIASGSLTAFPEFSGATGTVEVTTDGRGNRALTVTMSSPQPITGAPTVWLMDADSKAVRRMGLMQNGPTTIVIPAGMSIIEQPVVNISAEPADDTDDVHDGQSILQGTLA